MPSMHRSPGLNIVVALCITAGLTMGMWLFFNNASMGDEQFHMDQIARFLRGEWDLNPSLTTIPGYHAIMAAAAAVTSMNSLPALRLLTFVFSLLSVAAFFLAARTSNHATAWPRTMQYVFLPILFPLLFLVYTDLASLLCILLAFLAYQRRKDGLACWIALAAIGIRQNNILWLAFFGALALWRIWDDSTPRQRSSALARAAWVALPLATGTAIFTGFVAWNGGVAMGDELAHPFPSMHIGNVHFALFLYFWLFLPLHARHVIRLFSGASARRWAAIAAVVVAYCAVYWFTFHNTHPYNQEDLDWFVRNRVLVAAVSSETARFVFLLPGVLGLISLAGMRLRERAFILLAPWTLLALVPAWLIEQRYVLIPAALLLLMRESESRWSEYGLAAYWAAITLLLLPGMSSGSFFL